MKEESCKGFSDIDFMLIELKAMQAVIDRCPASEGERRRLVDIMTDDDYREGIREWFRPEFDDLEPEVVEAALRELKDHMRVREQIQNLCNIVVASI